MQSRRSTPTVAEDVADRLRRLIHAGALSAGDRLPAERDLAADLGVARVSVREAMRLLAAGGYIMVRRGANGGTFVAGLDLPYQAWLEHMRGRAGELDAILDLRVAVEGHAAYLAAQRRSNADLQALRRTIREMEDSSTRTGFRLADSQFHAGVVAAARSPRLEDIVGQARGEFFVPTDTLVFDEQIEASATGHAAVLRALETCDPDQARAAMADHIQDTRSHLHWLLRGNPLRRPSAARPPRRNTTAGEQPGSEP
jgi:GntR family transcriptional regulator, transcriptional repressor for pyruvate dehydrogenase complex